MAVGKEAPISNLCATAAACRASLDATVAQFSEVMEATSAVTVRRRLKDADIDLEALRPAPAANGFSHDSPRVVIECKATE